MGGFGFVVGTWGVGIGVLVAGGDATGALGRTGVCGVVGTVGAILVSGPAHGKGDMEGGNPTAAMVSVSNPVPC